MHCASDLRFVCSSDSRSTAIYTLSLHDALPISVRSAVRCHAATVARAGPALGDRRRTLNEEGLRAHQRPGAAELTGLVVPPAIGLALDREGAGEAVPDGDRAERHEGDHVARRQAELERHRAELPRAVVAPRAGRPV